MTKPLVVHVITRGDDLEQHVPLGFVFVDQVYDEAGLSDSLSQAQAGFWEHLRIFRRALHREFKDRVTLRVLNPWTPEGLWMAFRRRVRHFPSIIIGDRSFSFDTPLNVLIEAVREHTSPDH